MPKILIVVALASSIGLHWAFLQTVAWAGMIVSYAQESPLTEAVVKTFDGQHPCKLCKQIEKGKGSEKKSEYEFKASKVKFAYAPAAFIFSMRSLFWELGVASYAGHLRAPAPPVPPPRNLLG
jgi:hypothetical protein